MNNILFYSQPTPLEDIFYWYSLFEKTKSEFTINQAVSEKFEWGTYEKLIDNLSIYSYSFMA